MSRPLKEILFDIESILTLDPENVTPDVEERLDELLKELASEEADKVDDSVLWFKEQKAHAEFLKEEGRRITGKGTALENRLARLCDYYLMQFDKFGLNEGLKGKMYKIAIGRSNRVRIDDENIIPEKWWKVTTDRKVMKDAVKKAIKSGEVIPGVSLEETRSIQMR